MWLQSLLCDFELLVSDATTLFCDNISALALANNSVFHAHTKHITCNFHFMRDCIKSKEIIVHHISTHDLIVDLLTKALYSTRFIQLCGKLTIEASHVHLKGDDSKYKYDK